MEHREIGGPSDGPINHGTAGRLDGDSVLLWAEVLAGFHRLLLEQLGERPAHRSLTRLGFAQGWYAATMLRTDVQPLPREDALGRLLRLQGLSGPETDSQLRLADSSIVVAGCIEAAQHAAQYGRSARPVCWFTVGYVSGFLTRLEERPVVCEERTCTACGDEHCRILVNTLDGAMDARTLDPRSDAACDHLMRHLRFDEPDAEELNPDGNERNGLDLGMHSPRMQRLLRDMDRVAQVDSTVLITGESGVGKERLAHRIHTQSRRSGAALVALNCAAVADNLWDSELFGHRRGSFTGAMTERVGMIEAAHRGTLFLDEVGELPLDAQAKLLRALQEREIRRVGDTRTIRVDIRVVAATNRDLAVEVVKKRFREDLYYRLNVVAFQVPPLRERSEDLGTLARSLLLKISSRMGRRIIGYTPAALSRLLQYHWPGNVRELENAIERACALARRDVVDIADLPEPVQRVTPMMRALEDEIRPLRDIEHEYIQAVLAKLHGNKRLAAERLQIAGTTLYRKMRRFKRPPS